MALLLNLESNLPNWKKRLQWKLEKNKSKWESESKEKV